MIGRMKHTYHPLTNIMKSDGSFARVSIDKGDEVTILNTFPLENGAFIEAISDGLIIQFMIKLDDVEII